MDSLTQIVLGASVGEKFLGTKLGNRALLYGAIAGTIPDLDVYVGKLFDPITAIQIHRGFSHSILFFIILAPALGWILSKIESKNGITFKQATLFWFFGLLTHALLDAFTTWGTQLFYPFDIRLSLHSIFVIDPLYTFPFLFCLIMVMRFKRNNPKRQKWNNLGLIISSSYLLVTVIVQQVVVSKFDNRLSEIGISYNRKIVKPSIMNIVLWNSIVETDNGYYLGDYSLFDSKPISFDFYPKNENLILSLENEKIIQQLKWISEGWWLISTTDNKMFFNDIRFGVMPNELNNNPEFSFSYELVFKNGVLNATEVSNKNKERGKKLLSDLWVRLKGN